MHKSTAIITGDLKQFLAFMKERYHFYHASNVFFRDFHFGVMAYLELRRIRLSYSATEEVTREVILALESQHVLRKIDERSWLLNYPEYRKEPKKAVPAAKPAAPPKPAAPAPSPAN